jgi:transcription initiation factor TFIIF subunit alpha
MTSNPAATLNGVAANNLSQNQTRPPPRKKPLANPLVSNRRPPKKPNNSTQPRPGAPNAPGNPAAGPSSLANHPAPYRPDFTIKRPSPEPGPPEHSYPVYLASPDELESLRYHLARLQGKESLDVTDQSTFVRPVKLLRRDIYAKDNTQGEDDGKVDPDAEAEKERQETLKAERQRQKDEVAKQIAPSETKKKPVAGKRKTESRLGIETAADEKRRLLRYEETLPWILEDFDAQRTWVGSYEASLSDCHVLLIRDESGGFKLLPVEKTYRFKEKDRIRAKINPEKEEEKAEKKNKDPKWLRDREEKKKRQQIVNLKARVMRGMKTGASKFEEPDELGFGGGSREDMDFDDNELFADDEENPILEGDADEQKEAKDRIVSDQRKANYFDLNDETAVLELDEQQQKEAQDIKQEEKGARKALIKREGNYAYETSDDENPYASEVSFCILLNSAPSLYHHRVQMRMRRRS